jgi:hypothetical protein
MLTDKEIKMTRERAKELAPIIAAYGEGKTIEFKNKLSGLWLELSPFEAYWDDSLLYRIKPELAMRPMTRGEVLYMATTTPAMVVRQGSMIGPSASFSYIFGLETYEYAIIDNHGNPVDGWHKFEVAE